jgi:hypothetical protein
MSRGCLEVKRADTASAEGYSTLAVAGYGRRYGFNCTRISPFGLAALCTLT